MKKILFGIFATVVFSTFSYSQKKSQPLTIDQVLEQVTKLGDESKKIVTFNIEVSKDMYILSNVVLVDESDFINSFAEGFDKESYNTMKRKISIDCVKANGSVTSTLCGYNDGACVGTAIRKCLDSGGCAEVCSTGRYIP